MKRFKSILVLTLVVVLTFVAGVGVTMAYFMDDDAQVNTFTTGNVAIDLWEDFGDKDTPGIAELIPATGSAQDGTLKNGVEKEVYVKNTGSEDAYVRVHIAIPQILDNGSPSFDAGQNVLHFNYTKESVEAGLWNWSAAYEGTVADDGWNFYTAEIKEGIWYNVYVVTYETALKDGDQTVDAMHQVYLDKKVTNDDITDIKEILGEQWKIYVVAEGTQAAGFDNAYQALNESFGTPGTTGYVAPNFLATAENDTWKNND